MSVTPVVPSEGVETLSSILGSAAEPETAHRLHHLAHEGRVETIRLEPRDMNRKRLRARTDSGAEVMIALSRSQTLHDGAVLHLSQHRAVVVRSLGERWLRLRPADAAAALRLGYAAGNLHWRVRFAGTDLEIALEGERESYLARIAQEIEAGHVAEVEA